MHHWKTRYALRLHSRWLVKVNREQGEWHETLKNKLNSLFTCFLIRCCWLWDKFVYFYWCENTCDFSEDWLAHTNNSWFISANSLALKLPISCLLKSSESLHLLCDESEWCFIISQEICSREEFLPSSWNALLLSARHWLEVCRSISFFFFPKDNQQLQLTTEDLSATYIRTAC